MEANKPKLQVYLYSYLTCLNFFSVWIFSCLQGTFLPWKLAQNLIVIYSVKVNTQILTYSTSHLHCICEKLWLCISPWTRWMWMSYNPRLVLKHGTTVNHCYINESVPMTMSTCSQAKYKIYVLQKLTNKWNFQNCTTCTVCSKCSSHDFIVNSLMKVCLVLVLHYLHWR